jgi:acyl-ACP thioesterase
MSEKSLSIKIRRARKELRIMQGEATNIYSYLTVIKNIDKNNHMAHNIYVSLIADNLEQYSVKSITELEKLIRKQKSKIRKYDQRICKLRSTQNMK